ncbi:MAG: hypothetical protein IT306_21300 [Chloroflexi bacterium]|nr:hypothetical protein [Chloroflexota bacterium]
MLARSFAAEGFVPVMEYVVIERARLERYQRALPDLSLHLVVLNPSREVILQRDHDREKTPVAHHFVHLQQALVGELTGVGAWIDSSELTAEETVAAILRQPERARLASMSTGR